MPNRRTSGRILMVGALSIRFVRDNWVEPLRRRYGAAFVDVSLLRSAYADDFHEHYLYRLIQRGSFEFMFFYSEAVQAEFSDTFFERVRAAGLEVVVFHADDDPEVWYRQNAAYDHRYDLIYSPSRAGVERRRSGQGRARVEYLPWGYNPELFYPAPESIKVYDVVFIGANMSPPNNPEHYYREGYDRQRTLVEIDAICCRHGIDFALFGYGWDHHPTLHRRYRGFPDQGQLVRIYQQARIVVNTGFSADGAARPQTKLRHFEVAGCGTFQLVNDNPELHELFEPDREMVFYHDTEELESKLLYYLDHTAEREAIAAAAEHRVRHEHTQEQRLSVMFGNPVSLPEPPGVKTVVLPAAAAERERLLENLETGRLERADVIRLVDEVLVTVGCELSVLDPGWVDAPVQAWGMRSFLQLGRLHGNTLHRKKQDIRGVVLHERVDKGQCPALLLQFLRDRLTCLEDNEFLYPLCNLLVRPEYAAIVLRAYLRDDPDALHRLQPFPTGRLVNDFVVDVPGELAELTEARYLNPLRELLDLISRSGETLLIYGAQGEMVDQIMPLLEQAAGVVALLGFVDRRLAGGMLRHWSIVGPDALDELAPDIILIAAETSGPAIHRSLESFHGRSVLVPLYDLQAPVWKVLLPSV